MKNLLLVLLFVLPTALFSATPSCVAGMEVSLIDGNGKVIKSGKFDDKGELTLNGLGEATYSIRITNNGKSCVLDKPKSGTYSGLPTGKRMHKPIVFSLSSQEGSDQVFKKKTSGEIVSPRDAASGLPTGKRMHKPATNNDGVDQDCDDVEFTVIAEGNGKATIKEMTVTK